MHINNIWSNLPNILTIYSASENRKQTNWMFFKNILWFSTFGFGRRFFLHNIHRWWLLSVDYVSSCHNSRIFPVSQIDNRMGGETKPRNRCSLQQWHVTLRGEDTEDIEDPADIGLLLKLVKMVVIQLRRHQWAVQGRPSSMSVVTPGERGECRYSSYPAVSARTRSSRLPQFWHPSILWWRHNIRRN